MKTILKIIIFIPYFIIMGLTFYFYMAYKGFLMMWEELSQKIDKKL